MESANTAVASAVSAENNATTARKNLMLQIKDRTTRLVNYVGSNSAWDEYLPAVKMAADKVRNYRPKKKAERARKPLYDAEKGSLRAKMKAIKKATRGQYGVSSAQFAEIKSIRL